MAGPGVGVLAGEDFDDVTRSDLSVQGHESTVDLGTHRAMTHFGVNGVGKVNRGGPCRETNHPPLGREDVNLFAADFESQGVEELVRVISVGFPVRNVRQPGHVGIHQRQRVGSATSRLLGLVHPVSCHTELGPLVHFRRANLDLYGPATRTHHRRM